MRCGVDFIAHAGEIYDELCVGVVIASAEMYGHLPALDLVASPQCVSWRLCALIPFL
jgi:hypothetical protein